MNVLVASAAALVAVTVLLLVAAAVVETSFPHVPNILVSGYCQQDFVTA